MSGFNPLVHRHAPTSPSVGLAMLAAARRLGFRVVVVTGDAEFYGPVIGKRVDEWVTCDVRDPAAAARALLPFAPRAVLTSIDQFVGVAAAVAQALGIPGADPAAPALARDKGTVRAALDAAGLPGPRWALVAADAPGASPIGYPCVAKPVDGSASWDVALVGDDAELAAAGHAHLARATYGRGVAPRHLLLLEEVLAGPLYSAEGLVSSDGVELWGWSDRTLAAAPRFYETGSTFCAVPPHPDGPAFIERALAAAGYQHGPFHLELIVTPEGPRLVELNPRLIGGGAHECLDLACGADVVEHTLRRLLGLPSVLTATRASTLHDLYAERSGTVREVRGADAAAAAPGVRRLELRARPGLAVRRPASNSDTLGYVLSEADTPEESARLAAAAAGLIEIDIDA